MNYNCNVIHETIIRDIIDIINDVKDTDEVKFLTNKNKSFRSIAHASNKLTLVFPVIVSKNLNIDSVSMISKAIERKAISMLQILFSAISITNSKDAIEYIKKFHTNLKIDNDISINSFIDTMDYLASKNESGICINNKELYDEVKKDLKNINYTLPNNISENTLQNFKIYPKSQFGKTTVIQEKNNTQTEISFKGNINNGNRSRYNDVKDVSNIMKNKSDIIKNQLLDSDVKKSNELIPTMMVINFISENKDKYLPQQAVIGIKAKIYPIDSSDIVDRIIIKNANKNKLLSLIKATTREISFCRDFLFAIDKAKLDALSQSKRGNSSKLWKILERRSLKSRIQRRIKNVNNALAISTLVISQEEVEYLKKNENINIENPKTIRPIMEAYNLMGFCIVNESMEICSFIFDTGDDIYEQVPFRQLERESSNNEYKKIVNLMTKISR